MSDLDRSASPDRVNADDVPKQRSGRIAAALGGAAAALAVAYGWWAGVRDADGSLVVLTAAVLATLGLLTVGFGMVRGSRPLAGAGLLAVGVMAPTGFGYLANLAALVCGAILILEGLRRARPRR
jgi:hypothetical protein